MLLEELIKGDGWDFSAMDVEPSSSTAVFQGSRTSIELDNFVQRNYITPSSSRSTISKNNLNNSIAQSVKNRKRPNKKKNYQKNFREIPIKDLIIGCNNRGAPDTRCLVPEENNPNFVKEYTKKAREYFYCNGCGTKQKLVGGKMIGDIFYAPENHLEICFPILRATAENRLRNNKDKAPKKQLRKKNAASKTVQNDYSLIEMQQQESEEDFIEAEINQSPIEIITIDDESDEETFVDDKNFKEECIITKSEPGYSETITFNPFEIDAEIPELPEEDETAEDPLLKRLKLQNEYLSKLVQLNQSQNPSTVTSSNVSYFHEFNHPSTNWLKNACKKLKLIYHQSAYQLWANFDIIYITEKTKPNQILAMDNGKFSGFRALSFVISGQENQKVKNIIYKYFLENFKNLGFFGGINFSTLTIDSEIINETIFAEYLTPELWEIIAKMLECRIGIFIGEKLVKYGNWNSKNNKNNEDDEIITLLFQIVGENYCVVKSVINQ